MGSRAEGTEFWEPDLIDFVGVELLVPAQGNGINLSTRVSLHSQHLSAVLGWELKPGEKGYLAI